ncbi:signal recognition particle-docking protein FtsY [Bifidobacterium amazonense]|uniref:Signal recognition particle receptor FtsY n=1 Tax=Bifidobacterium amazonense TaxID=2809027 RepID=A0ABS9VXL2_9BIFI|nr:signal recognition particle-docking protein FtsY [Bifidobacterium amazonense]MCH9276819.1 signal recognition particle-docking protein FtsY [Bifidobacterium amazonense]
MDTNMIIGIVAVVVIVAALIAWGVVKSRAAKQSAAADEARQARQAAEAKAAAERAAAAKAQAAQTESKQAEEAGTETVPSASVKKPEPEPSAESAAPAAPGAPSEPVEAAEPAPEQSAPAEQPAPTPVPVAPAKPAEPAKPKAEKPESALSRIQRLKAKLANSSNPFGKALFNILAKDNLTEADWEDVEDTLLLADVGAEASEQLVDELRKDARITGKADPADVRASLREKLLDLVGRDTDRRLNVNKPGANKPSVIIMVGVNGTGKTTTAGKLARLFVADGKQVVMGAADTFRAAAADQLETWGAKVNVPVVRSDKDGADPASVAFEASARAKQDNADVLIIDTAGRLQNKANLMDELGKIRRVTEKNLPVDEVLLVLDATTGQNGMTQAKVFAEAIGITGVVLSKLDGSAKGGIVISVQKELGVPVKLVGLGEGPDDLAPFDPEGFVDGILA